MRLSARRRLTGLAIVVIGAPAGTALLAIVGRSLALGAVLLLYLLLVVVAAAVGGLESALLAAVAGFLLANWFFAEPAHTFTVAHPDALIELATFLVVAGVVSFTVHLSARAEARAARSQFESRLLARMSAEPVGEHSLVQVLTDVQRLLGMTTVALATADGRRELIERVGEPAEGPPTLVLAAGDGLQLQTWGPQLFGADQRLLTSLAGAAARAHRGAELAAQAARAQDLAIADRVRAGLLAAVGHDLRTPLAAIKAAVTSLRAQDVQWTAEEEAELLASIEDGTDRLGDLVANLLALSRLQAGSMPVHVQAVGVDEVVAGALLHVPEDVVHLDLRDDLPLVLADPGLLERVVANLVDNALRYTPAGAAVQVRAGVGDGVVRLRVTDHGPGVPAEQWPRMFVPFQRLDDRSAGARLGLGLAIAEGFTEAMGGTVRPSPTPGGGLTMTVELRCAPTPAPTPAPASVDRPTNVPR
jgi:K+-sensing histidine kinase KdpD